MFCPKCGSTQDESLKFCTACGSSLYVVKRVETRHNSKLEKNTPWFAEMALSDAESKRRQEELNNRRGIKPEINRYNEIKAGIITSSAGIGVAIFLYALMEGIVLSGSVSDNAAEILSRLWIAGIIPIFIGFALIVNGVFVSKKLAEAVRRAAEPRLKNETNPLELPSGEATEFLPADYSVTENTTQHLDSRKEI